jgi:isoamylase
MISQNMSDKALNIGIGKPQPLGATVCAMGVNFALFTQHATNITLCLFSPANITVPLHEIPLEPSINKTGNIWHILIHGIPQDLLYAFRLRGPITLPNLYNESINLIDPYAKQIVTSTRWEASEKNAYTPLGAVSPDLSFDWENDKSPQIPLNDLIIYEMHVRGFTQDPSSEAKYPGTFLGLAEKVQHLVELGVNAVELMPVFEFNECEYKKWNPTTGSPLYNYWGYSSVNFFAPMQRYAFGQEQNAAITEFKTMVKILHRHGIEVILDVVYNHTAEGNHKGPIYSFKGIDNAVYYMFDSNNRSLDFTGCGNTFNCNHPDVQEFILDSLRYWVSEMHVDGFRFDLTSIFTRGIHGQLLSNPPLLEAIAKDPILSKVKMIAEPWDASGLFQLGLFAKKYHWSEWNGRYRDSVRKFIKGGGGNGIFVTNLCGSQDIFYSQDPTSSINFVTAHDGFTLADLVSYNQKHNVENGEENRDGINYNESWNCGSEGITQDKKILNLREKQMRNFHLALMISRGVPMLLMGDEYGHTKRGNNNTWCQDNELNWFSWPQLKKNQEFFRFYRSLIDFRKKHPVLKKNKFYLPEDLEWHGKEPFKPEWNTDDRFVAFVIKNPENDADLYVAFNTHSDFVSVTLPPCSNSEREWYWIVNTASPSPYDFREESSSTPVVDQKYRLQPYSAILLKALPARTRSRG